MSGQHLLKVGKCWNCKKLSTETSFAMVHGKAGSQCLSCKRRYDKTRRILNAKPRPGRILTHNIAALQAIDPRGAYALVWDGFNQSAGFLVQEGPGEVTVKLGSACFRMERNDTALASVLANKGVNVGPEIDRHALDVPKGLPLQPVAEVVAEYDFRIRGKLLKEVRDAFIESIVERDPWFAKRL